MAVIEGTLTIKPHKLSGQNGLEVILSRSLGIAANMYKWKELHEQQAADKVLVEDEREELKHLRKEVKELRMEKEIL